MIIDRLPPFYRLPHSSLHLLYGKPLGGSNIRCHFAGKWLKYILAFTVRLNGVSLAAIFSKAAQRPLLHLGMHDLRNELFPAERADKIGIDIWVAAVFSVWTFQFHDALYLPKRMAVDNGNMIVLYIVAGYHSRVVGNALV